MLESDEQSDDELEYVAWLLMETKGKPEPRITVFFWQWKIRVIGVVVEKNQDEKKYVLFLVADRHTG